MRGAGLPIEVLVKYVRLFQQDVENTIEARKELFIEQREQLIRRMEDMKKTLERLDYKIAIFEHAIVEKEKALIRPEE